MVYRCNAYVMPSNLLIVTGSETYAFDMGIAASRFTDVAVVRWTSVGQFEGSLFELFFITGGQVRKISSVKLPLRIRNKPEWFVSRVPLFVLNTWLMFSFAIKARRLLGKSNTRVLSGSASNSGPLHRVLRGSETGMRVASHPERN